MLKDKILPCIKQKPKDEVNDLFLLDLETREKKSEQVHE